VRHATDGESVVRKFALEGFSAPTGRVVRSRRRRRTPGAGFARAIGSGHGGEGEAPCRARSPLTSGGDARRATPLGLRRADAPGLRTPVPESPPHLRAPRRSPFATPARRACLEGRRVVPCLRRDSDEIPWRSSRSTIWLFRLSLGPLRLRRGLRGRGAQPLAGSRGSVPWAGPRVQEIQNSGQTQGKKLLG
jgi:hypothetical protein